MFALGLEIAFNEFRSLGLQTGLIARGVFAVLVAVPVLAIVVARLFELSRPVAIGVLLMAISPGAPVIWRRRSSDCTRSPSIMHS